MRITVFLGERFGERAMSAPPFSSELKVILALTALLIGWVFAAMVPKNDTPEQLGRGSTLTGVLSATGETPCLDGNGAFGYLSTGGTETASAASQIASILLGRGFGAVSDSFGTALSFSGPGAKTDAFASKPFVPKKPSLSADNVKLYRNFWSGNLVTNRPASSPDGGAANQSDAELASDALANVEAPNASAPDQKNSETNIAAKTETANTSDAAPNDLASDEKASFDRNAAAAPVATDSDALSSGGFSQEDLLSDRQKGPISPRWKEELEVVPIEGPEFTVEPMPDWNDVVALNGSNAADAASAADPLAQEAKKAEAEGLLADSMKVARPVPPAADSSDAAAAPIPSDDELLPSGDSIHTAGHFQTSETEPGAGISPVAGTEPSRAREGDLSRSVRTGTLVVRKKPTVRSIPAPTPVTIYTVKEGETAADLLARYRLTEGQKSYFYELNKGKFDGDGPIHAGTEILIPKTR